MNVVRIFYTVSACIVAGMISNLAGQTLNRSYANEFQGIVSNYEQPKFIGKQLVITNRLAEAALYCDTTIIAHDQDFTYTVRIACDNNKPGKTYKAKTPTGKNVAVNAIEWGVAFMIADNANYYALTLSSDNNELNEISRERIITASLIKVTDGTPETLQTTSLSKHVDLYNRANVISIQNSGDKTIIKIGNKRLKHLFTATCIKPQKFNVGIFAGPASILNLDFTSLKIKTDPISAIHTEWTQEALDAHFMQSVDPYEGYWKFLDRSTDDTKAQIGGKYIVALVRTTEGYDVIYIDGAVTNDSLWTPGMLKARLGSTIFSDNFDMQWWDSDATTYSTEDYATFESAYLMTLHFPMIKSQIRFSKIPISVTK